MSLKRVIIESPYAVDRVEHLRYLERVIKDSLERGEAPFASHGFYTIFLDDDDPRERAVGMECGWAWMQAADFVAVYEDYGRTKGMRDGIERAAAAGKDIDFRKIGMNPRINAR